MPSCSLTSVMSLFNTELCAYGVWNGTAVMFVQRVTLCRRGNAHLRVEVSDRRVLFL